MTTKRTIKLQTYNCDVVFILTDTVRNEALKIYKLNNALESIFEDGDAEGLVFSFDLDRYYFIINLNYLTHNTIAHELHHVVMRLTRDRGVFEEEAQCWVSGHLAQEIYKFLHKKNFKIKHGR